MKINWKQKLSSRKFLTAIIGFITTFMIGFNVDNLTIEKVVALVTAGLTLIAYILSEAKVDAARINNQSEEAYTNTIGFQHTESDKNDE